MTDLAREIEELLPCWAYSGCTGQAHERACLAWVRPAITTYVQRKLDVERARREFAESDRNVVLSELEAARADSELLAKVEKLLHDDAGLRIDTCAGGVLVKRSAPFGLLVYGTVIGDTLVEALRKLVGEET